MYNINLIRYALVNQIEDSTVYKIQKIKKHYLEVIQGGEFLYNFKDKEEACQHLIDIIILKSINDFPTISNNDRELIKLVLENKALFDENINVFGDIKEKAKSFKYTVFEYETIEDYKAALEDFILNDGAASAMSAGESDETPNLDEISDMLDDALCDMEHGEMLNGKELPTKPKYAIAERELGLGATDWKLKRNGNIYNDLGTAIDFKPNNYVTGAGLCRKQFEIVNLSDPDWKQSLIENDDEEYFIMKRELIRSGTAATDWEISSDIFKTWSEAKSNMQKDYDGNFQFIIASRPKEKKEKKVESRRRIFNFGD